MNYNQIRHALQNKFIITPWYDAEKTIQLIEAHGRDVSLILGAIDPGKAIPSTALKTPYFEEFRDTKNIKDPNAPKIEQIQNIFNKIKEKQDHDIIMFCCSGAYGRSPALAILHIMKRDKLSMPEAESFIRQQKPLCVPNDIILSFANDII